MKYFTYFKTTRDYFAANDFRIIVFKGFNLLVESTTQFTNSNSTKTTYFTPPHY